MSSADQANADQLAFWNGTGGRTWVERQEHTDITLEGVSAALVAFADPRAGEQVMDVGCGCGATTLDIARAVGPSGRVVAMDISAPMLEEGRRRATAAALANVDWRHGDPATADLSGFDLLVSAFGVMFFGDPVAAFAHMRGAANPGARMAFVTWRALAENPWMSVPMEAAAVHLPPRPTPAAGAPGMFAFADGRRLAEILVAAGWTPPTLARLDVELDIAAGRGFDEAVVQSTRIGAVGSWLRDQDTAVVATVAASIRRALQPYRDGDSVRLDGAMWLVASSPA